MLPRNTLINSRTTSGSSSGSGTYAGSSDTFSDAADSPRTKRVRQDFTVMYDQSAATAAPRFPHIPPVSRAELDLAFISELAEQYSKIERATAEQQEDVQQLQCMAHVEQINGSYFIPIINKKDVKIRKNMGPFNNAREAQDWYDEIIRQLGLNNTAVYHSHCASKHTEEKVRNFIEKQSLQKLMVAAPAMPQIAHNQNPQNINISFKLEQIGDSHYITIVSRNNNERHKYIGPFTDELEAKDWHDELVRQLGINQAVHHPRCSKRRMPEQVADFIKEQNLREFMHELMMAASGRPHRSLPAPS